MSHCFHREPGSIEESVGAGALTRPAVLTFRQTVFPVHIDGRAPVLGPFALVCSSALEAFKFSGSPSVGPFAFRAVFRFLSLPMDISFVTVCHVVHIVPVAGAGAGM